MDNYIEIIFDGAIGDTIGLTILCDELNHRYNKKSIVYSNFPFIFNNNPNVIQSYYRNGMSPNIEPCRTYSCNIVQHYFNQMGISYEQSLTPKIYLTDLEKENSKIELQELSNHKKIAVCLYSSADSRDLRYENIKEFLLDIKSLGYKLIFFGTKKPNDFENLFERYIVGEYAKDMRRVFSLLSQCNIYLGVDTGLFHAAAAVNIPQMVFFRNNGCKNNAYKNTYYIDSFVKCSDMCHSSGVVNCFEANRCMDNFDFKKYLNLLKSLT